MSLPKYPHYKPSGVQWLGDVPAHWDIVPLKYVVSMRSGGTPDKSNTDYWEGSVPWASAKDLKVDDLWDTADHITDDAVSCGAATLVPVGSVLVVVRGMILARLFPVVVAKVPMAINQDLKAVIAGDQLCSDFLAWLLRGSSEESLSRLDEAGHGTKALRMDSWSAMQLPVPSLHEQTAIAHFLDHETAKIDALIAEQEKLIHLLAEKRQATLSHAVTRGLDPAAPMKDSGVAWLGEVPAHWTVTPLKHLVNFRSGGTPSKEKLNYWNGDVPWASAKDMKTDRLADTIDHITAVAIEEKAADLVPRGAVLVVVRGMILARMFPVSIVDTPMAINQDLKAVIPGERIDSEFLAWLLRGTSDDSLRRLDEAGHGTKALRMDAWASMLLPVPPIPEQARIAQFIEQEMTRLAQLQNEAEHAIALLKERRAALIAAAVTGQIDVRQNSEILNGGESRDAVAALS